MKSFDFTAFSGAVKQSKSEPFPSDAASVASPKVTVCVPSLYKHLIIVEIDGIDEGIHQCLPPVFQAHIQLAEPQQPSQSNFLIVCNIVGLHIAKYVGQNSMPNLPLRLNRTNSSFIFGLASRSSAMRAYSSMTLAMIAFMEASSSTSFMVSLTARSSGHCFRTDFLSQVFFCLAAAHL